MQAGGFCFKEAVKNGWEILKNFTETEIILIDIKWGEGEGL